MMVRGARRALIVLFLSQDGAGFLHLTPYRGRLSTAQRGNFGSTVQPYPQDVCTLYPGLTPSIVRGSTATCVSLAAKKRRRRRVDESVDESPSRSPGGTDSKMGTVDAMGDETKTPVDADDESEDDDESDIVGGVVMPPLPSGLSGDEIQREDDEMAGLLGAKQRAQVNVRADGGSPSRSDAGAADKVSLKKTSKYSFGLDIELPVESETQGARQKSVQDIAQSPDGVMPLPNLSDLDKKRARKDDVKQKKVGSVRKVDRGDVAAFTSLLELDPEADGDETLFTTESYDAFASILGEGKPFVGIANSYLQSGHTVLLALTLLCGFVDLPGFPLTQLPYEIRGFLKTGLAVVYVINVAIAYLSFLEAKRIGQPPFFWVLKGFVLGGLAFNELSQIEPEMRVAGAKNRRGKRRRD